MANVEETQLPGVGVRYEFVTDGGMRIGVIHHRTGRRELCLYAPEDPDTARETIRLSEKDSQTLHELLGGSHVLEQLGRLQQSVSGLAIDWLAIPEASPFAGATIGDTRARTRTGVSIVAVLRGEGAFPAPGPEQALEADDTLVVVGTPEGIERLSAILRTG